MIEQNEQNNQETKGRREWDAETGAEYLDNLETSGRKGLKLSRINMAFSPDNYQYIQVMSKACGESLTQFVNRIIKLSRENNAEAYKQALNFRAGLK